METANEQAQDDQSQQSSKQYISGYAIVYNSPSQLMTFPELNGGKPFREVVDYGACSDFLKTGDDTKLLVAHDTRLILATRKANTLAFQEDAQGLGFEALLDLNQTYANDVKIAIERGDVINMSFYVSLRPGGEYWKTENGTAIRHLTKLNLREITITGFPAYEKTFVELGEWRAAPWAVSLKPKLDMLKQANQSVSRKWSLADAQKAVNEINADIQKSNRKYGVK